jgi:FMN phosphatase YigB (HAD superfamily)
MEGIISSFNQVVIKGAKILIICDIDDTLLRWTKSIQDVYNSYLHYYPHLEKSKLEILTENYYSIYRNETSPIATDDIGFKELLSRLGEGKLIFVTARKPSHHTRDDFINIGLRHDIFDIHFTANKIPKGEYIKKYINLSRYDDIIFIDDNPECIQSVLENNPQIRCYLFTMRTI